jgi:ferredoxin
MVRLFVRFSPEKTEEPVTAHVIKETGATMSILNAKMDQSGGEMLINVDSSNVKDVIEAFRAHGAECNRKKGIFQVDENLCIYCGGCYSLCPVEAIMFEADYKLIFIDEKCIACKNCEDACPVKAIKILT